MYSGTEFETPTTNKFAVECLFSPAFHMLLQQIAIRRGYKWRNASVPVAVRNLGGPRKVPQNNIRHDSCIVFELTTDGDKHMSLASSTTEIPKLPRPIDLDAFEACLEGKSADEAWPALVMEA